jgi:hypothetical protein
MTRFELIRNAQIQGCGGAFRADVILDRNTIDRGHDRTVGEYAYAFGYVRCRGRHYIGDFGSSPVYGGEAGDVYYDRVMRDGAEWFHASLKTRGGNFRYVIDGKLFDALEKWCEANEVAAVA